MTDKPKAPRKERFTMLEPMGPNNPSPEELATRIVDIAFKEQFTMMEPMGPNTKLPGSENWPVVEPFANGSTTVIEPKDAVPPVVLSLVAELATAVAALDERARVAALNYIATKLPKRTAG